MVLLVQTGILSQGHSQGSCHATLGQRVSPIAVSNRGGKVIPECEYHHHSLNAHTRQPDTSQ